ncbi:hypothetical protein ACRE_036600 [Hapsidospora chrysogenum ATCC 11550]|uniref:non-specific serine/threonine protein kinase n=1 Tax=Hapsidospora chrysogenum (strain ATCC 11550 / CBS 779.69 / DSM 880 / IAM 14645 / JCM 23072 / IMI 49137) TaxID=857340 RepID=A0A086T805_HAPC1|nr:hypothetical protein ACRE_036600 [Hapsidospora chrysogenum ATCC 11550]
MGLSIGTLFPLRWRLWLGRLLFKPLESNVTRISLHRVIKGPVHPPEVEAMQYVASHTTIPIPKVYKVHTLGNSIFIEMAYIRGEPLSHAWRTLTSDQKKTIFADIKQYVSILRELPPPKEDLVSSAFQNPAQDGRIGSRFFGPMNHGEFHRLTRRHPFGEVPAWALGHEVEKVHTSTYRTHFTHADLAPRNIIVRGGRVAAIIDWAYSGWYPEYWEFTRAHYTGFTDEDYFEYFRSALPCYDLELAAEQSLWSKVEEPGTHTILSRGEEHHENPGSTPSAAWMEARAGRQLTDLWSLESRLCSTARADQSCLKP